MCAVLVHHILGSRAGPPVVRARGEHGVVPTRGRLRPVMPAAQRGEAACAGGTARGIGDDMVYVAGLGRGAAVWEHALWIPPVHLPAQAVGNLVAAHGYMLGEIEDRADGDASCAAPLLDLVHAHRCLGVLAP